MSGQKKNIAWFFTLAETIGGWYTRLVGGGISKPTEQTFRNLLASIPFFKESNSKASKDTGQALENKQGLVIIASDVKAKAGTNTPDGDGEGTLVPQPSQLPTLSTENQTVGDFTSDTPLSVVVDSTTTRNNYVVKLKASFITFLNKFFPSFSGSTGKYLKSDGTSASWDAIDISTGDITGTLPIVNGGTGGTTAILARNALLPSKTGNTLKVLRVNTGETDYELVTPSTSTNYIGISTSNITIGTGSKTFVVTSGMSYTAGTRVRFASDAVSTNYMEGNVFSYSGTSMIVTVDTIGGSGTLNDWNINIGGSSPLVGDIYKSTSSTSNSIALGSKIFAVGTGYSYAIGNRIRVTDSSNSVNYIDGIVTAYSAGNLTILVDNISGSGTITSWLINLGTVASEAWINTSATTGTDIASNTIQYKRDSLGRVHVRGTLTFDGSVSAIANNDISNVFPSGYRPTQNIFFPIIIAGQGYIGLCTIASTGTLNVTFFSPIVSSDLNNKIVNLDNITFLNN